MEAAPSPNPFVVEPGPGRSSHAADVAEVLAIAFVCFGMGFGFLVAFVVEAGRTFDLFVPWGALRLAMVVLLSSFAVAALYAWRHDRRPDSLKNWRADRESLNLERASLALMLWAIEQPGVPRFPSEPTTWTVVWRADLFGMYVETLSVRNAAHTVLQVWDFEKCPEGLRHLTWPVGPMPLWQKGNRRAIVRAAFDTFSAHRLLALRAALNPL